MTRTGTPTSAETIAYRGRRRDVSDARSATRLALASERYSGVRDAAVLAVSELVTNAVMHAPGPMMLRIVVDADRVRLEVSDSSHAPPRPHEAAPGDLGGRGLAMVLRVVDSWGHDALPDGQARLVRAAHVLA